MRISRSVEIRQSPRSVWATLEDFDRWSKWATPLGTPRRLSDGPWQLGWRAKVGGTTFEITDLTPGKQMIWFGSSLGTTTVWTVLVEPVRGKTEATIIAEQSGWMPAIFGRWTGKGFAKNLQTALEEFRKLAESSPATPRIVQQPAQDATRET